MQYQHQQEADTNDVNTLLQEHVGVSVGGDVSGSFALESGLTRVVAVTLTVAGGSEGDVESFELTGPAGRRERYPVYLDG